MRCPNIYVVFGDLWIVVLRTCEGINLTLKYDKWSSKHVLLEINVSYDLVCPIRQSCHVKNDKKHKIHKTPKPKYSAHDSKRIGEASRSVSKKTHGWSRSVYMFEKKKKKIFFQNFFFTFLNLLYHIEMY